MRIFLHRIFLFCIPIGLLLLSGEIYVRLRPSSMEEEKKYLEQHADSIEILVLGNSHAMNGILPSELSLPAYNVAYPSQSIYFDRRIFEKYLPHFDKLKYVILCFDYFTLFVEHVDNRDFFYKYHYDINYKNRLFWKESISQVLFVYSSPQTFRLLWEDLTRKENSIVEKEFFDSLENQESVVSELYNTQRGKEYAKRVSNQAGRQNVLEDLEALIKTLKSKNITPILINYPANPVLRTFYDNKVLEENKEAADYFVEKYGVVYLDYGDDNHFEISDYFDPDHLNLQGAAKLTARVDSLIMQKENNKQIN